MKIEFLGILEPGGFVGSNLNFIPLTAGNLPSRDGYFETPFSNA